MSLTSSTASWHTFKKGSQYRLKTNKEQTQKDIDFVNEVNEKLKDQKEDVQVQIPHTYEFEEVNPILDHQEEEAVNIAGQTQSEIDEDTRREVEEENIRHNNLVIDEVNMVQTKIRQDQMSKQAIYDDDKAV